MKGTYYVARGIRHEFEQNREAPVALNEDVREWLKQWTTPNNTHSTLAASREEAFKLWKTQKFALPYTFRTEPEVTRLVLSMIRFSLRIERYIDGVCDQDYETISAFLENRP